NPKAMGAAGHALAQTPHLDALARRGTRFTAAYTTSPICVPARAGFATGKYPHQVGFWDNADAYDGSVPSWHHLLRAQGHKVVSFVCPHFPLVAQTEFYYRYPHERIPLPKQYAPAERPDHPYLREYHACVGYDDGFGGDPARVRRAIAGYLGLVSFMDHNVGQ